MAYIIPSDISRLALAGASSHELETLGRLKTELPDAYTVFHGVHWSREYEGWTHFGEIDFVVINRSGDALLIEQKNGGLEESGAGLVKHYGETDKNVVEQVHRSLDKVRQKFQWQHGRQHPLHLDYLLYCPDYRIKDVNAAGLAAERVVDATTPEGLAGRIQQVLGPGSGKQRGWHDKVHAFFCQTFQVVPDIHAHVAAQGRAFVRQVGGLATVLANLEMTPFRLRVMGAAGSGKSLVARYFFAREAAQGHRVLMVCFNRPLAERLKRRTPAAGYVNTFYGFCHDFLASRGQVLDFDQAKTDPDFWRQVQERVMAEPVPPEWVFDALVVDEGQDFETEWLEILGLFLTRDAAILWLEDPDQNLQDKRPVVTQGFVGYRCQANYRSPESIARFIRDTLPFEFDLCNDLPGLGVGVHGYGNADEQPRIVAHILQDLVTRGFSNDQIVILTCRGVGSSVFSGLDAVAGLRLRRFTGDYDDTGAQVFTKGQIHFDSVYRFKGQEAPAVILVDVDPNASHPEREQRVLFCGMTRATVRLDMVARQGNPANRLFWEALGRR